MVGCTRAAQDSSTAGGAVTSRAATNADSAGGGEATPLSFLNDATRKFASWEVSVARPRIAEYTYYWEGRQRTGKIFHCTLVSVPDDTQYCSAEVRKTKGIALDVLEKALKEFQAGFRFRMSKVALNSKAKPEYNNAACKIVVDLTNTTMTKILHTGTTITPQPSITCAECLDFNKVQAFDITALVESVSEKRNVNGNRRVRDVYLIDGTLSTTTAAKQASGVSPPTEPKQAGDVSLPTEPKELIRPKVQVFYEAKSNGDDPEFVKALLEAKGHPKPFHFYGLTAQFKDNGYIIETMRGGYFITPATGSRAEALVRDHQSILAAKENTTVRTLEKKWEGLDEELIGEPGQETFCAHLADMSKPTGISALDDKPTVWQTNWVFPTLEPGTMLNNKGRLWLTVTLEDLTGQTTVTMDEKTALSLSGREDADGFLQAVSDGDPVFPSMLSAKIVRRLKTIPQGDESAGVTDAQQEVTFVNNHIVEVSRQDTNVSRTDTCLTLIDMLRTSAAMSSAILPASLGMVMPSKLYPLLVQYPIPDVPPQSCKKIWVLIKATKKSTCTDHPPYQVVTDDVEDVLDAAERDVSLQNVKKTYKMITMCSKDNRSTLMLTPSHGKHVHALAVITAVNGNTLYAENVESLQQNEKDDLAKAICQEMTLATRLMQHTFSSKSTKWDETTSPIASSRCRALGRSPTGPELDVLNMSVAKKARNE